MHENGLWLSFCDVASHGAALVLEPPTAHYADVFDTPTEVLAETVDLVRRLARAMRSALNATGVPQKWGAAPW
ncbi:hypothetical protein ACWGKQ_47625, partial [Streptomyces sp. NPDC054770]